MFIKICECDEAFKYFVFVFSLYETPICSSTLCFCINDNYLSDVAVAAAVGTGCTHKRNQTKLCAFV